MATPTPPMADFRTPEFRLSSDLISLSEKWQKLGIDPDDFVRCGKCHEFFVDEDGGFIDCVCDRAAS